MQRYIILIKEENSIRETRYKLAFCESEEALKNVVPLIQKTNDVRVFPIGEEVMV